MAKIKCSNCGNELKRGVYVCPNCGTERVKKRKSIKKNKNDKGIDSLTNVSLEKKIAVIDVNTASKEGYRDYAEKVTPFHNKFRYNRDKSVSNFIIVVLLIIIFILSILLIKTNNQNTCIKESQSNNSLLNEIKIYYSRNNKFLTEKTSKSEFLGVIKATDSNVQIYDGVILYDDNSRLDGFLLLYKDDDKIKFYNSKTNKLTSTILKSDYDEYRLVYDYKTKEVYGISFLDGITKQDDFGENVVTGFELSGYFNIINNEALYVGKEYYDFSFVSSSKIKAKKGFNDSLKLVLLDSNIEKVYLNNKYDDHNCGSFDYSALNSYYLISGTPGCIGQLMTDITIYDNNMDILIDGINEDDIEVYRDYLYVKKNNKIYKYSGNNIEFESKNYSQVLDIIHDYFIVVDNNTLTITNEDGIDVKVCSWDNNSIYQKLVSGYYSTNFLSEKRDGIYLIVQNNNDKKNIEYYFDPNTNIVEKRIPNDLEI